eukprot:3035532-Rhodomonas_salina.1
MHSKPGPNSLSPDAVPVPDFVHQTLSQYRSVHTIHYPSTGRCTPYTIPVPVGAHHTLSQYRTALSTRVGRLRHRKPGPNSFSRRMRQDSEGSPDSIIR